ncbi:hypothetical protein BGI41_00775 [Methanobrevibacter sp. 87.7]|nr:hypothetical protein BGI41_00775 [Methanobrevibacter sp. 87.7]
MVLFSNVRLSSNVIKHELLNCALLLSNVLFITIELYADTSTAPFAELQFVNVLFISLIPVLYFSLERDTMYNAPPKHLFPYMLTMLFEYLQCALFSINSLSMTSASCPSMNIAPPAVAFKQSSYHSGFVLISR